MSSISHILSSAPSSVGESIVNEVPDKSDTNKKKANSLSPTDPGSSLEDVKDVEKQEAIVTNHKESDSEKFNETQQRKRSKVSRACDECRRKKIRCDATFSTTSNTLEKICSSCFKNNYSCTFERVPLKRGPIKGYSKDSNNGNGNTSDDSRSRASSFGSIYQAQHGPLPTITLPPLTLLAGGVPVPSQSHHRRQKSQSSISSRTSNTYQKGKAVDGQSSQALPQQNPYPSNVPSSTIPQSQFWKVPYEAPFDRRGSVDSISSSVSDSRFNFSQGLPIFQSRYAESSVISDSDDDRANLSPRGSVDFRSGSRSRSSSNGMIAPTSPALSISSLKSLNQGLSKSLTFNNPNNNGNSFSFNVPAPVGVQQQQQQLNPNYLIDSYYRSIHPTFPILPLNSQSLINILSSPPLPQSELNDLNHYIIQNFHSSLDLLISATSKQRGTINTPSSQQSSTQYLETLTSIFNGLSKTFPIIIPQFEKLQQHVIVLFLSSIVVLSYIVVLLGNQSDVIIINSSIQLFNKLKLFKLFWTDNSRLGNRGGVDENYDDYHFTLKRLWLSLGTLDTLHSLSHGIPRKTIINIPSTEIDRLFPDFQGVSVMKDNYKLGWAMAVVAEKRNFNGSNYGDGIKNSLKSTSDLNSISSSNGYIPGNHILNELQTRNITNDHFFDDNDSLPFQFIQLIATKFELIAFLEEVTFSQYKNVLSSASSQISESQIDEDLLYDQQLKLSRLVKKLLNNQSLLFTNVKNHTNSIDTAVGTGVPISPFLPLVFKQSIKILNILKILINSLQKNEALVGRVSKLLNDLIKLSNFLSLIKPFTEFELNNHLNFDFKSDFLEFWESVSGNNSSKNFDNINHDIASNWIGLMYDLLIFMKREDYDGWF